MATKKNIVYGNGLLWLFALTILTTGIWVSTFIENSALYRLMVLLGGALIAIAVGLRTTQGIAFWSLLRLSRAEIRKVVWPTHPETVQTLVLITIFVILMALVLWGLDSILGYVAGIIIA